MKNLIPKPWIVLPKILGLNLNCQILGFEIELNKIKDEYLNIVRTESFIAHSGGNFKGGWGSIGLMTYGGNPYNDLINKNEKLKPTKLLEQCNYIQNLLNRIPGKKDRVRFMEVKPNTKVYWHYDNGETIDGLDYQKNARFHIPILTNDNVEMRICHQKLKWQEGKLYYGDFSFPHEIHNKSNQTRIHLIIDININDDLIKMFPKKYLGEINKRRLIKKICQRSYNLYRKLGIIKSIKKIS